MAGVRSAAAVPVAVVATVVLAWQAAPPLAASPRADPAEPAVDPTTPVAEPDPGPVIAGYEPPAFSTASTDPFDPLDDTWTPTCTGTGGDGHRVQAILAYDESLGPPTSLMLDAVRHAVANTDLTFAFSAIGSSNRSVRWVTDHGSPGCAVSIVSAPVSTGLASFSDLIAELQADGVAPADPPGSVERKYLVWTEGAIDPGATAACGQGQLQLDDRPGSLDNANGGTSYAALRSDCWDINSGISVPAHELMHTFGGVQPTAPHHSNAGHCTDDHDNMCYGPSTAPVSGCTDVALEATFDCNDDDYFDPVPTPDTYLCRRWNAAMSPFLYGWDTGLAPIGALGSMSAVGGQQVITVNWTPPAGCPGPSAYRVTVPGVAAGDVSHTSAGVDISAPAGSYTVEVRALRDGVLGPASSATVTVTALPTPPPPNAPPTGRMVLSLTRDRGYGMLAWARDPETGAPPRARVRIEGVGERELEWNYWWADMPAFTGVGDHRSYLFLARLPPGTRQICFDALDPQGLGWVTLECRTHTVK